MDIANLFASLSATFTIIAAVPFTLVPFTGLMNSSSGVRVNITDPIIRQVTGNGPAQNQTENVLVRSKCIQLLKKLNGSYILKKKNSLHAFISIQCGKEPYLQIGV